MLVAALGTAAPAGAVGAPVTVSPDRDLADTAFVDVSGTGFDPNTTVLLFQCTDVGSVNYCTTEPIAELDVNFRGSFAVDLPVHAVITTSVGSAECRTGCDIVVLQHPGTGYGRAGLSFSRYSSTK